MFWGIVIGVVGTLVLEGVFVCWLIMKCNEAGRLTEGDEDA